MARTLDDVRAALGAIEPNYPALAAELGPEALPHLAALARDADPLLASKAVYLASLIKDRRAAGVVREGAKSAHAQVRVAAAAAAENLTAASASTVLLPLVADADAGVRKTALRRVPAGATAALRAKVAKLTDADPEPALRALSAEALGRIGR